MVTESAVGAANLLPARHGRPFMATNPDAARGVAVMCGSQQDQPQKVGWVCQRNVFFGHDNGDSVVDSTTGTSNIIGSCNIDGSHNPESNYNDNYDNVVDDDNGDSQNNDDSQSTTTVTYIDGETRNDNNDAGTDDLTIP